MAVLNHILFVYGGELSVAVYGIINRVLRVTFMPVFGIVQAYLPITGYNYGAGNFKRVLETLKKSMFVSIFIFTISFLFRIMIELGTLKGSNV
jgi:Na+-driven multidrug efflux pump